MSKSGRIKFAGGKKCVLDAKGNPVSLSNYGYKSGDTDRYTIGFTTMAWTPSQLISLNHRTLIARAQELERSNDHVRGYLRRLENNVVGANGIRMKSKATTTERGLEVDRDAVVLIEYEYEQLCGIENACCSGDMTMTDIESMVLRRWTVDGEVFIEDLPGYDNEQRFAHRIWEASACPIGYTDKDKGIYFGIKFDKFSRPLSYFFHRSGEGALPYGNAKEDYIEVPADRVHHVFKRERPTQKRGITAFASTAERMYMLDKFERATLIGAQIASSKMGFFRDEGTVEEEYTGDGPEMPDTDGPNVIDIAAGQFEDIGTKKFEAFDVEYPPAKYAEFVHESLRSTATGMNASYHTFANDPASVNYSTAREFRLADTDDFRRLQSFLITRFKQPAFRNWLKTALLRPEFSAYQQSDYKRLRFAKWMPRGWKWVDPQKEGAGNLAALAMGVTSPSAICADMGEDFEEVIEQFEQDAAFAKAHGLNLENVIEALKAAMTEPTTVEKEE